MALLFGAIMSNQHTPGPWRFARSHEDYDGPLFELEPGETKPITRIFGADNSTVVAAHDLFELSEANARLIAKAPDMYNLLADIADDESACTCGADGCSGEHHAKTCNQGKAKLLISEISQRHKT